MKALLDATQVEVPKSLVEMEAQQLAAARGERT